MKSIGQNLIDKRGSMTQTELAIQSGVNQRTISAIEKGRIKFPTYQTAFKLSNVLGCEPDLFLDKKLHIFSKTVNVQEAEVKLKPKQKQNSKLAALKNKLG